jgi:predicted O-methyltransferase YrrM/tetratricopeptide (TPR) repeat protein
MLINNKYYNVNSNEYIKQVHAVYTSLNLYEDLAIHEQIIGFIKKLISNKQFYEINLISLNTTHGGFIPINVSDEFYKYNETQTQTQTKTQKLNTFFLNTESIHEENIKTNIEKHNIHNTLFDKLPNKVNSNTNTNTDALNIMLNLQYTNLDCNIHTHINLNSIIITNKLNNQIDKFYSCYKFINIELYVYVSNLLVDMFEDTFKYSLTETKTPLYKKLIDYNNLLHLCIMVKNAGQQFKNMLLHNSQFIDKWTILDTGSTDDTINIIQEVLVGKKEGTLYQEPFINFRDSRNRLLDLAGNDCKYIVMLDDTYMVEGDLHQFLREVRSDQYASSFTLFINTDDTKYGSNRIIKANSGLRYIHKIHEVISDKNNINVVIPENACYINDMRFEYMEKRTMERKQLDLKLLFEEIDENPNDPRAYYYLAQTYNLLEDYEKAYHYFMKRCEFTNAGFIQERIDAAFEAARMANFKLGKPWTECEALYLKAFKIDETRPESIYFIGAHYYLENNYTQAHKYFKQAFEIGFPEHCQYSLKPTLSYHFLPKLLTKICYNVNDYELGLKSSAFFILNNQPTADSYQEIVSWYNIFQKLTAFKGEKRPTIPKDGPICCFVADGGFHSWSGSNINTTGVGGSETYIIEMARHIKQHNYFNTVIVFCNCPEEKNEIFEGVLYCHLNYYYEFIHTNYVHTTIVSRFSEYLPVTYDGFTENVYFIIHDLTPSGNVVILNEKLKNVFCLTEWHVSYFTQIFPTLTNITVPFYYGIDDTLFVSSLTQIKIPHKFIYSSFPNRGLLELLKMWPKIYQKFPTATLFIYSNIDNEWSNKVEPEKMKEIKQLLNKYVNMGIFYKGWVSKKELADSWKTADIWFYPCTFQETFCLTALEAASSKTFAITNGLAALQNTVANRGITIQGDATTEEWQSKALTTLFKYMSSDTDIVFEKELLVTSNYEWSKKLSWKSQAQKLHNEYIVPNGLFEYKGMYNWTNDIPKGSLQIFRNVLDKFVSSYWKVQFQKHINILEIGTYSGMSLIEMVKYVPNSFGIGLDLWSSYNENSLLTNMDNLKVKDSFYKNIKTVGLEERIKGIQMNSKTGLIQFIKDGTMFDIIYVDGSHLLLDAYMDIVLSWEILEKGGYLIIDDYLYNKDELTNSPFEAVNHFLKLYDGQYNVLSIDYRVFLEKK